MRPANRTRGRRKKKMNGGCAVLMLILIIAMLFLVSILLRGCSKYISNSIDGIGSNITKQQHPIKHQNLVEEYAKAYKIDKYLVYAVIKTESKFDQYAVSSAGAYGLMQLQVGTASDCAKKLKMDVALPDDLYKPEINIKLGTYYLSWLMQKYDDDISLAVAAYNGGIGNVDGWLEDERYSDGKGGLKDIPFTETKNYVVGVAASYEKYKELYK